jgi:ADP-ribosylation factor-like protein 1
LKDAILLVFANKQDSKGALNAQQVAKYILTANKVFYNSLIFFFTNVNLQVSDALGLPDIKNRQWSIQETSALKGAGLFEGFDWYVIMVAEGEAK